MIDDFNRECLALVVDTSLSGLRVSRELDRLVAIRRRLQMIVSDNGTVQTSNAILKWSEGQSVEWHHLQPSKPTQNAFAESFIGCVAAREALQGRTP